MKKKHNSFSKKLLFLGVLFIGLFSANVYAETTQANENQAVTQLDSWEFGLAAVTHKDFF